MVGSEAALLMLATVSGNKMRTFATFLTIILFVVFANGQHIDFVKEYYYKVNEKRIRPDTSVLHVRYFDKLDNEIGDYDAKEETTSLSQFQNKKLTHVVKLYKMDTVSLAIYRYLGIQSFGEKHYKDKNLSNEVYEIQYTDTSCQKWTVMIVYQTTSGKTIKVASWFIEYDSIGRKCKRYIDTDSGRVFSLYTYESENRNRLVTKREDFEGNAIIYEVTTIENSKKRITLYSDLKTKAKTKSIDYFDKNGFLYRKEDYGTIFYTCNRSDPRWHAQGKPITTIPDQIIIFEKFYYR